MNVKYLEESTVLNYMNLVLSMQEMLKEKYSLKWREPGYNFYVEKYQITQNDGELLIRWLNSNNDRHFILYRKPRFKSNFLNKLYFTFFRQYITDDAMRAHNVLLQVIYPEFCKELGITGDFSKAKSAREAADLVMCSLYQNYFTGIPLEKFMEMFNLNSLLSKESIQYIKDNVGGLFVQEGEV